jgi:hypothetical protein
MAWLRRSISVPQETGRELAVAAGGFHQEHIGFHVFEARAP